MLGWAIENMITLRVFWTCFDKNKDIHTQNDLGTPRVEVSFVVFLFTSKLKRMEFSFVLWFLRMIAFLGFLLLFYF